MKNEKFLRDIQIKYSDIANEILNAAIDAERTFKCNRHKILYLHNCLNYFQSISFDLSW